MADRHLCHLHCVIGPVKPPTGLNKLYIDQLVYVTVAKYAAKE